MLWGWLGLGLTAEDGSYLMYGMAACLMWLRTLNFVLVQQDLGQARSLSRSLALALALAPLHPTTPPQPPTQSPTLYACVCACVPHW